jgi:hypothetical protein
MFEKLKSTYNQIKSYESGARFISYHRCLKRRGPLTGYALWLSIALGIVLLLLGFVFSLLPVLPGFIFAIPGLAILASRAKFVAVALDQCEVLIRRVLKRLGWNNVLF